MPKNLDRILEMILDKYPVLFGGLERVLCPRVHFKMLIFDMPYRLYWFRYLTGAGLGMKSMTNRNFETGILTNEVAIVKTGYRSVR